MKFSNLLIFSFIYCLIAIFTGCSKTPTSIERVNPNDPFNPDFTVNVVENFETEILADRLIQVSWKDTANYGTGYVIRKSVSGSINDLEILDTLEIGDVNFTDTSENISFNTLYGISKIIEHENGLNESDTSYTKIDFGDTNYLFSGLNADSNAVIVDWEFETLWPYTSIVYSYNESFNIPVDTLYNGVSIYQSPTFELDFAERYYSVISRIDLTSTEEDEVVGRIAGGYYGGMEFAPEITSIEVVNEGKVIINWEDNSSFEDGFRILRSKSFDRTGSIDPVVIAEIDPNITSFTDTLNPLTGFALDGSGIEREVKTFYGIQAFKNETQSGSFGTEVNFTPPEITLSVSNLTEDSFELQWSTNSFEKVSQFTLQASSNGNSFYDYKTFQKGTTKSVENSFSTDSPAYFRIKTETSKYSNRVVLNHTNYLVEEQVFQFPNSRNIRFSDSGNLIIVSKAFFSGDTDTEKVGIFDIKNNSTLYNDAPIGKPINGVDIDEENNLMALASYENQLVTIYNFDTKAIEYNASINVFDVEFGPENKFVYTNSARDEVYKIDLINKSLKSRKPPFSTTSSLRNISLSPTGDSIAYNSDGFFRLLNSSIFRQIEFSHVLDYGSTAQKVDFSKSGKYISNVSDFDKAEIHSTNPSTKYFSTGAEHISISFNDKYFVTSNNSLLKLFELDSKTLVLSHHFSGEVLDLRFSPSEELIAVGSTSGLFFYSISEEKKWGLFQN